MTGERGRIVVGVDGSPCATEALRWALGEARLRGVDVEMVTSWHAPYMAEATHASCPVVVMPPPL